MNERTRINEVRWLDAKIEYTEKRVSYDYDYIWSDQNFHAAVEMDLLLRVRRIEKVPRWTRCSVFRNLKRFGSWFFGDAQLRVSWDVDECWDNGHGYDGITSVCWDGRIGISERTHMTLVSQFNAFCWPRWTDWVCVDSFLLLPHTLRHEWSEALLEQEDRSKRSSNKRTEAKNWTW